MNSNIIYELSEKMEIFEKMELSLLVVKIKTIIDHICPTMYDLNVLNQTIELNVKDEFESDVSKVLDYFLTEKEFNKIELYPID